MSEITITFMGELNDFISLQDKFKLISYSISFPSSIKDVIESLGVPHPEVDLIIVNNQAVDFSYQITDGDDFSIYPYNLQPQKLRIQHLIPSINNIPTFILDSHLGKLASYLRMLGFDTDYNNKYEDQRLAEISSRENRILLSRDIGLLKRKVVKRGYFIRSKIPRDQLIEIIHRFKLRNKITPFKRCIQCNGSLNHIAKSTIEMRLQEKTKQYYDEFMICDMCSKIYWKGSHFDRMKDFIGKILIHCDANEK
jgi:uncharacterized protein with PIN domain